MINPKKANAQSVTEMLHESLTMAINDLEQEVQGKLKNTLSKQEEQVSQVSERINLLTQELEKALLEFNRFGQMANQTHQSLQSLTRTEKNKKGTSLQSAIEEGLNIVVSEPTKLPMVEKSGLKYILKDRIIGLA